jgi:multiple sugar transport system substrate-binding protein
VELRSKISLALILALTAACTAGGGPTPSATGAASARPAVADVGPVRIEMWQHTYAPLQEWTKVRIAEFTSKNPNVTVDLQAIPFQQYQDKLFTAIAGGKAPAFFEVNEWTMTQFVQAKLLAPLDVQGLGFKSLADMRSAYEGQSLDGAVFDNAIYGSPYDWSAPVLGVNNALLAASNVEKGSLKTWDGLLTAATKMSKSDANGNLLVSGFALVHSVDNYYKHIGNSLFAQAGARIVSEDGKRAEINSPAARRVFQLWSDAIHVNKVTKPGFTSTFYTNEFAQNRVASGFMLTWANSILAPFKWTFGKEYDILDLPTFSGGTNDLASYAWYWTVNAKASQAESVATHALIAHLSQNSANMLTQAGLVLPRTGWYDSQPADVKASYTTIRNALLRAKPLPKHARYNEIWQPVITVFQSVETNPKANIEALLTTAAGQIDGIINRP